jgi:hypothetical protein
MAGSDTEVMKNSFFAFFGVGTGTLFFPVGAGLNLGRLIPMPKLS